MKPLIQYTYSCTNAMFNYLKDNNLENLISELRRIETHAKENIGTKDAGLWFKFGEMDTLSTTIREIENDLSLPVNHNNHRFMMKQLNWVTKDNNPENELKVYFS